jgi:hypothetical protein
MFKRMVISLPIMLILALIIPVLGYNPLALPPLPWNDPDPGDKQSAEFTAAHPRPKIFILPEDFGAKGDGATDDTAALQTAIHSPGSQHGYILLKSSYVISRDIILPRNVCLIGYHGSSLKSASGNIIKVKGFNDPWYQPNHLIEGITFNNVGILYGEETSDNGSNVTIDRCLFTNITDKGVQYRHNCWNTLINNTLFVANKTNIYFDFATAYRKSGSNMRIVNSVLSHGTYGIYLNGDTIDGCHIQITNSDFEFLDYGVKTVNIIHTTGSVLDIFNSHFELNNRAHIDNDGAYINVVGGWYFTSTKPDYIAHFVNSSQTTPNPSGRITLSNARIAWVNKKFCKITGGNGIYIDNGTIWDPFPNQFQLGTDDSTMGPQFDGGHNYTNLLNQSINAAQTLTYDRLFPWDTAPREYTIDFTIGGTPDDMSPPIIKFVNLNKDSIQFALTHPETGTGTATIIKTKDAFKVNMIFNGAASGTKFYGATVANTQSLSINGGMDFIILQLGKNGTATVTGYSCTFK